MSEMSKDKKPEFVVTDRRKFTVEGEPRPGAENEQEEAAAEAASTPQQPAAPPAEAPPAAASTGPAAPQQEQKTGAQPSEKNEAAAPASGPAPETGYDGDTQRSAFGGQKMEFIHLLDMLVQTAMMYAGAMESGAERRVDIVGLRQMIDLIGVLEEKTRGNLSSQEEALLTNTIFQLRMTYMEIVNMIERQAMQNAPGAPGSGRK
jgi:hypothetical protein